jgi:glycosyltransferase involved in cell wall biosynthesis
MKLLFVGPLMDFSGFATASRYFLRMLSQMDIDLVARPLQYDKLDDGQKFIVPDWMSPLLSKDITSGVDLVIQMTTCNIEAVPVPGVCNALYTFFESDRLQPSWAAKANEFDFLIVPCRANAEAMLRSGVQRPIMTCAPPCDLDRFQKDISPYSLPNVGNRTVFYNICQLSTKKGIDVLLRAYFAAFADMPEDVMLVLKTYVNMQNRVNDLQIVRQYIEQVKAKCRIPIDKFPPVLPIVYTMTDEEIDQLHAVGHAYVCSSRAEGWCVPAFDALSFGKTLISHQAGGLEAFVKTENALLYQGMPSLFYDQPHPDPGLFTGVEQCFEPSPAAMALLMRHFHLLRRSKMEGTLNEKNQEEWNSVLMRRENGKTIPTKLDYRVMPSQVEPQLRAAFESWKKNGKPQFLPKNNDEENRKQTQEIGS